MGRRLVLVEGLPGFGKTTAAKLVQELLTEKGIEAKLFLEGNLDHPADYDGYAYFTEAQWQKLLAAHSEEAGLLAEKALPVLDGWVIQYQKLRDCISETLLQDMFQHDIYELPLAVNQKLIADRWRSFAKAARQEDCVYVFECCFIQNPMTISMIKYDAAYEQSLAYVQELAQAVQDLQPLLIYVNQEDLEAAFRKALAERPKEWAEGFAHYYTKQGYGQAQGHAGIEGTIAVLEERRSRELELLSALRLPVEQLVHSASSLEQYKERLAQILENHIAKSETV